MDWSQATYTLTFDFFGLYSIYVHICFLQDPQGFNFPGLKIATRLTSSGPSSFPPCFPMSLAAVLWWINCRDGSSGTWHWRIWRSFKAMTNSCTIQGLRHWRRVPWPVIGHSIWIDLKHLRGWIWLNGDSHSLIYFMQGLSYPWFSIHYYPFFSMIIIQIIHCSIYDIL